MTSRPRTLLAALETTCRRRLNVTATLRALRKAEAALLVELRARGVPSHRIARAAARGAGVVASPASLQLARDALRKRAARARTVRPPELSLTPCDATTATTPSVRRENTMGDPRLIRRRVTDELYEATDLPTLGGLEPPGESDVDEENDEPCDDEDDDCEEDDDLEPVILARPRARKRK